MPNQFGLAQRRLNRRCSAIRRRIIDDDHIINKLGKPLDDADDVPLLVVRRDDDRYAFA